MIDKLDVRISGDTPFTKEFHQFELGMRYGFPGPFRSSRYYRFVCDLRKHFNIDAVLHLSCKTSDTQDHKLEIIDAGEKPLEKVLEIVTRVFDVDPLTLGIMRIDLAADVFGIPVFWFRDNASFDFKRFASSIENTPKKQLDFIAMGTVQSQSIYAGRRPNCVRVYNKLAELKLQWRKYCRDRERFNKALSNPEVGFELTREQSFYGEQYVPSFEEFCSWHRVELRPDLVLTRVERQIGGDRVPRTIATLGLLENLRKFDPFEHMQIRERDVITRPSPDCWEGSIRDYLAVLGVQGLLHEFGNWQSVVAFVKRYGKGNGKRLLESLLEHCAAPSRPITRNQLTEIFHNSVEWQLLRDTELTYTYPVPRISGDEIA